MQDRVEVLQGWFRATGSTNGRLAADAVAGGAQYNISLTVAGSVDDFDSAAFHTRLRAHLQCDEPRCRIALQMEAASVRVLAMVTDETSASISAAVLLGEMGAAELLETLGVSIEGAVEVGGRAMSLLTADGLAPVRCPERESCLGGDNSSCAEGHTGALCGVCDDGHFRSNGACVLCDADAPTSVALYASAAAVTLAAAFAFMYVQLARGSGGGGAADGDQRGGPPTTAASPP